MKKILILIVSLLVLAGCQTQTQEVLNHNLKANQAIEKIENKESFILYIYSDSCPFCVDFYPIWNSLEINYPEETYTLDLEAEGYKRPESLERFQTKVLEKDIDGTPTIIVFKDGVEKDRLDSRSNYFNLEKSMIDNGLIKE